MPDFCQQFPFINKNEINLSKFSCPVVRKLLVAASEMAGSLFRCFSQGCVKLHFTVSYHLLSPLSSYFPPFLGALWFFFFLFKLNSSSSSLGSGTFCDVLPLNVTLVHHACSLLFLPFSLCSAGMGRGGCTLSAGSRQWVELWGGEDLHCEAWIILLRSIVALFAQQVQICSEFKVL